MTTTLTPSLPVTRLFNFEVLVTDRKSKRQQTLRTTVASASEARERAESYGMTVVSVTNLGAVEADLPVRPAPRRPVTEAPFKPGSTLAYARPGTVKATPTWKKWLAVLWIILMVVFFVFIIIAALRGADLGNFNFGGSLGAKEKGKDKEDAAA